MRKGIPGKMRFRAVAVSAALLLSAAVTPLLVPNDGANVSAAAIDANFAKALQYSLYFYDANMCGTEVGENTLLSWRGDCHPQDANAQGPNGQKVDVSGGYHDAGDHVKFGLPQAYSASILEWGYYEFSDAYKASGQTGHFKTISNYFADYFKKSTIMDASGNVQYFCYQVGDGHADHDVWEAPEVQNSMNRPTFWASSSNPATDIVSNAAGALALHYANTGDADSLKYAKALYSFAKGGNKGVASQGCADFYKSDGYLDDIAWAAACLYTVTNDNSYKSDASGFISSSNYAYTTTWPLCWNSMWPAVNALMGDYASVKKQISGATSSSNYYFASEWGSARLNTAVQLCALVAAKHTNDNSLASWAKGQMEYLMGNNSQNKCYIVGYNQYTVKYPHHRASSGLSDANNTGEHKYVLLGALVGGPENAGGGHNDITSNYIGNEVAVDYNAAFVGACAGLYKFFGSSHKPDSAYYSDGASDPDTTTTTVTTPDPVITTPPNDVPDSPLKHITISASDIKTLKEILLGKKAAQSYQVIEFDFDNNNKLTVTDLVIAKKAFIFKESDIPVETTPPPVDTTPTPTVTTPTPQDPGSMTFEVNETLTYGNDSTNNVKIDLEELLPAGKTPTGFVFKLSANSTISTYQGAYGISVDDSCPAKTDSYWYMGKDFEKTGSSTSMTLTFEVPSSIQDYVRPGYGANVYLGCWYCNTPVKVLSVTCYYE